MIASVSYTVPVQVVVDMTTGEVLRVVVIDESIEQDPATWTRDYDTEEELTEEQAQLAYRLADGEMWPQWEYGW